MNRTIAIGDIHGCSTALRAVIKAIDLQQTDTVIPLGDYVNRGIDSKGVIDTLIDLQVHCNLVPILGNHDQMMLRAQDSQADFQAWLEFGGISTMDSYGEGGTLDLIPKTHFRFLEQCRSYYETDTHVFLHANYRPDIPMAEQDTHTIRWLSLRDYVPPRQHCSNKIVVVGHTPKTNVLDLGYLICLDTGCCKGGWLTAMDIATKQTWMSNEAGALRG